MFYDRFLELCHKKGVKPTNACLEAGLSRGLAAKWKATKTEKPSAEALEKMSIYFGVSIDEILSGEKETAPTPEDERDVTFDDFTYAMYEEGKELTQENKDKLLEMARFFKQQQQKHEK